MKRNYQAPRVEQWILPTPLNLHNTLSTGGDVDEWIQNETEMDESNYI